MIKGRTGAINPRIERVNWATLVATLVTWIAEQAGAVVNVVAPCVGSGSHQARRKPLFEFCLERVVVLLSATVKCTNIAEVAWRSGTIEAVVIHDDSAQAIAAGA